MQQTKDSLIHDHNLAAAAFNAQDYSSFFRNIRPAIERLSQLLIFDIMGDEEKALDLINGDASITKGRTGYDYCEYPANFKPTGKALPQLFLNVFFCTHPDVYASKVDENKKRLRQALNSYSSELCRYYSVASQIGAHAGKTLLNVEKQAIGCAAFITGLIDFLISNKTVSQTTASFLQTLEGFSFKEPFDASQFEEEKNRLIRENQQKELALAEALKLQAETELREATQQQAIEELKARIAGLEAHNNELQNEIDSAKMSPVSQQSPAEVEESEGNGGWDVAEESMDDDQIDLIETTDDKSMLVAGCAGSGKSVIAMHKAEQLHKAGHDVILIAFTKSLKNFMRECSRRPGFRFYYHYIWEQDDRPAADYIIVDEIQDFTRAEVGAFILAAKKHFLFFGDTAQSIYRQYGKNTMDMEEISIMTGLPILKLYNNYRLPRPVAKITQNYVGVNVDEYKDKVYKNKETELPHFVHFDSEQAQLLALYKLLNDNSHRTIGILLPSNEDVLRVAQYLKDNNVGFEFKYNSEDEQHNNVYNLDFQSIVPKIMTYHSAKGLQFELVILPFYKGASDTEARKTLYVAMTRTMQSLYVFYSSPTPPPPLDVPQHLYLKE